MPCGSCTSRKTIYQVRFGDNTIRRYASEAEAKAVADKTEKAEYQIVQR